MDLTVNQVVVLLKRMSERKSRTLIETAYILRIAIAGSLTKEGNDSFERTIDRLKIYTNVPEEEIVATKEDLRRFGIGEINV